MSIADSLRQTANQVDKLLENNERLLNEVTKLRSALQKIYLHQGDPTDIARQVLEKGDT